MTYTISKKFVQECEREGVDWGKEIKSIWGEDVEIIIQEL